MGPFKLSLNYSTPGQGVYVATLGAVDESANTVSKLLDPRARGLYGTKCVISMRSGSSLNYSTPGQGVY